MKAQRLTLHNFRGVQHGIVHFDGHCLLVGSNGVGKSTLCEALDLVLGPDRTFRRPVIDEYDFYNARYLAVGDEPRPEVRVEVVLTELSSEAERRFHGHLRRWSRRSREFLDVDPGALAAADDAEWCLPVVFIGWFDPEEDDFDGGTFFAHPEAPDDDPFEDTSRPGHGLKPFTREDKRRCGFLYLRPNRTGTRALSFQRGSLLDTIVRLESDAGDSLWETALGDVSRLVVATEESGFEKIRAEVRERISRFVHLTDSQQPIDLHVSELTREHLREVLRLFVATQPGSYGVPFNRLSTGTVNLLVFALLTYIAELKGDQSVIFAMEEPEIALPPHAQRRLLDFVLRRMGQAIVTSHSPYVIEKFEPGQIVVLAREHDGGLSGTTVALPDDFKVKRYRDQRRQFAEAVLARAVLVVEGATEAALIPVIADVLDQDPDLSYTHPDLAGVSVFDAGGDVNVPVYAPVFAAMGKRVYGVHDRPRTPLTADLVTKAEKFTVYREIDYAGVEDLLAAEVSIDAQRRFAADTAQRADYPSQCPRLAEDAEPEAVRTHTRALLKVRKGSNDGYATLLIGVCRNRGDLPASLVDLLLAIDADLHPSVSFDDAGVASDPDDELVVPPDGA
jgi:putative ATP-dependent endonuclease of OLD family